VSTAIIIIIIIIIIVKTYSDSTFMVNIKKYIHHYYQLGHQRTTTTFMVKIKKVYTRAIIL